MSGRLVFSNLRAPSGPSKRAEWWAHLVGALRVHLHKYDANYPPQKDGGTPGF